MSDEISMMGTHYSVLNIRKTLVECQCLGKEMSVSIALA